MLPLKTKCLKMSSPCTRLVRCRVKDLASCFYAGRLPSEEKEPANGKKIFESKDGGEYLVENNIISQGGRVVWGDGNGSEPHFAEEDYIVFCFREDGEIDMINECKIKSSSEHADIISATTNRKKVDEKSKEKGTNDEIKDTNSVEQTNNASKMESFDSNQSSDTSTSSFAFPKLGLDWIGSPVHMPKSEKAEARNLRLHCCSF